MANHQHEHRDGLSGILLIDTKKCQGCLTCVLACSLANTGEESLAASRIQVRQNSFESYPQDISLNSVQRCELCADAAYWKRSAGSPENLPCVMLCPVGAIRYSPDQPPPGSDRGDGFNFRGEGWKKLGYPVD